MPNFYSFIDLQKNELRQAVVQNLGSSTPPSSPLPGQLWYDSTANQLKWYNGSTWMVATGSSLVPAATVTTQAVGDAPVVGTSTNYAREDHKHGREAFGAITAEQTFGAASGNGSATTLARSDHTHGNPTHDAAAHAGIPLSALAVPTASINLNNQKIINLLDPTNPQDATSKNYVDNLVAGLAWKAPARAATTANITLSGTQTVDGVALVANDRVLVKNQTTGANNGIYVVAAGAWTRSTDADAANEVLSMAVYVEEGTTQADTAWVCTTNAPITVGTTSLTFVQFTGAGTYSAGNGLTLTGNVFAVGQGQAILSTAGQVAVDLTANAIAANTRIARKFVFNLAGTASPEVVTHNLGTQDIALTVLNGASPFTAVEVDWDATSTNTATIRYNPNLGAGYHCVVVG